jgi:hypothetical protein
MSGTLRELLIAGLRCTGEWPPDSAPVIHARE